MRAEFGKFSEFRPCQRIILSEYTLLYITAQNTIILKALTRKRLRKRRLYPIS